MLGLLLAPALGRAGTRIAGAAAVLGVAAAMAGPVAYAADTIATAHTGSIPSAGPASAAGAGAGAPGGAARAGARSFGAGGGTPPAVPPNGSPGPARQGQAPAGVRSALAGAGPGAAAQTSAALVKALRSGASSYRWVAATSGSQSAAGIELASDESVMAIGGFNGQGGDLSLAAFERYVAKGEIHYYVASERGRRPGAGGPGSSGSTAAITTWVKTHFTATTIGGQTIYDLTLASD